MRVPARLGAQVTRYTDHTVAPLPPAAAHNPLQLAASALAADKLTRRQAHPTDWARALSNTVILLCDAPLALAQWLGPLTEWQAQ